jgi:hypothetical protein
VTSASRQSPAPPSAPGGPAGYPQAYPGQTPPTVGGYAAPAGYTEVPPGSAPAAPGPSAPRSVEQRLADLEDLHRRGVINADEYAAARIRILGEL